MLRYFLITGCLGLAAMTMGCASDTSAADAKALQDKEVAWNKDVAAKDASKFAAYYAEDGNVLMPNEPIVKGLPAIKAALGPMMQDPNFTLSFATDKAEASGGMGYTQGHYTMTMSDPTGKKIEDKGKYLTVWKKQADGNWLAVQDMLNSDLPLPAPPDPKLMGHETGHGKAAGGK